MMTQRVFVPLLTAVVFVAGYGARAWTERGGPVPPPPAGLANEYARAPSAPGAKAAAQLDRAKLVAEIEKMRPQIVAYSAQVAEISTEFDREFALVLATPEQKEKFAGNQKKSAEHDAKKKADTTPLSDEDIQRERDRPLSSIYWMVTVTPRLESLTKDYALDAEQQAKVRALLALRRNKFTALLDSTPHPSIRLSRLAPLVERVVVPAK